MRDYQVHVTVSIPIGGDESMCLLTPPEGFSYVMTPFNNYEYRYQIVDGNEKLQFDFMSVEHQGKILSLEYENDFLISYDDGIYSGTWETFGDGSFGLTLDPKISGLVTKVDEIMYPVLYEGLFKYFALLRVFKEGDFSHRHAFEKIIINVTDEKTNHGKRIINIDEPTLILNPLMISEDEAGDFQAFIVDYDVAYDILADVIIRDFEYTYRIFDHVTAFKNLISGLEALLVDDNERGAKKYLLGKRIAVLLETDPNAMNQLDNDIIDYYNARNTATHSGNRNGITPQMLANLKNISRRVIKEELENVNRSGVQTFSQFQTQELTRLDTLAAPYIGTVLRDR